MKDFKIGKFVISKKGVLLIVFGLFGIGVLIGSQIALSITKGDQFKIGLALLFSVSIWVSLYRSIKKETRSI